MFDVNPVGFFHSESITAPLALPAVQGLLAKLEIGDSDVLYRAVMARLGITGAEPSLTREQELHLTAGQVQTVVTECTQALRLMHTALKQESDRRHQLELEVAEARHHAFHDSLTTLPNRSLFHQTLADALAAAPDIGMGVAYIDLDGFKSVNDMYGHDVGDEVLRIVALRLARALRSGDMVSRLGGDEFVCMLADMPGRKELSQVACKLFDAVSSPMQIGRLSLILRPSIGISICPEDGTTAEALLKCADSAMYRAKRHNAGYAVRRDVALIVGASKEATATLTL